MTSRTERVPRPLEHSQRWVATTSPVWAGHLGLVIALVVEPDRSPMNVWNGLAPLFSGMVPVHAYGYHSGHATPTVSA